MQLGNQARTTNSINQNGDVRGMQSICNSVKVMESDGNTLSHSRLHIYLSYPIFFSVCVCVWVCEPKKNCLTHLNWISKFIWFLFRLFFFFANISLAGWFAFRFAVKNKTRNQFVQTIFISKTTYYKLNKFPAMMCEKLNEDWILLYLRFLSIT